MWDPRIEGFGPRLLSSMNHSKRYQEGSKLVDRTKKYSIDEAIALIKQAPSVKFDAGVELHIKLGIDPKKAGQTVRGTLVMPHGTGKVKRIIAFVPPEKEAEAKAAGADLIGNKATIAEIATTKKINFDIVVAHPGMMRELAPIARILGQKGLMPNPKTETVGPNIAGMIKELQRGKIAYRNDDTGNLHLLIGRVSASADQLKANLEAVIDVVKKAKPEDLKGSFFKNVVICSSMGPSIKLNVK